MSSSDPSTHKGVGRGVRNFDTIWVREKQNAVSSGNYAKFRQNQAMKLHLLSTGNKRLANANPLDPVWGIGLRADDPRAKDPHKWRGKYLRDSFFMGDVCLVVGSAFFQMLFFPCSWLHSQTVRGVGVGFEEPHLRLMV